MLRAQLPLSLGVRHQSAAWRTKLEKRYQIFISSTFTDLIEERQSVLKGILEIDHMPAGMELFPAADSTAWELIKDVIDSSDYYVLIVGGRYGSADSTGISYTEKEYDYAVKQKKPVIALLHKNPDNLPRDKTEADPKAWTDLSDFRKKVEKSHTCVYWETAEELKAKVIVGMTSATKRHPAEGWVRAGEVPSGAEIAKVLELKDRLAELEAELQAVRTSAPSGTEDLMQGEDLYELKTTFAGRAPNESMYNPSRFTGTISPSWNELFAGIAPILIDEASDFDLRKAFDKFLSNYALNLYSRDPDLADRRLSGFKFRGDEIDTCIIQLRALGLIAESKRKRSVRDTGTYWKLTPFGDKTMVQLRAIRYTSSGERKGAGAAVPTNDDDDEA